MKVIAFGEILLRLMAPDHKLLTQTNHLETVYCGTGLNILAQLSKWKLDSAIVTSLPNNSLGEAATAQVGKLGIDDEFIHYHQDTISMYFLENGYGNRPSQVTYMNRLNSAFSLSSIEDYPLDKILNGADAIHICGISLALSENVREAAISLAKKAKEKGVLVFFDFNYRASLWKESTYEKAKIEYERILPYCDCVFAGKKDAELILGIENKSLQESLQVLQKEYQLKAIACSLRKFKENIPYYQGLFLHDNHFYESECYQLHVFDRIGAGDAYAAGIIYGLLKKHTNQTIVDFATGAAVLAHTIYGDIPLSSIKDIERVLNKEQIDIIR